MQGFLALDHPHLYAAMCFKRAGGRPQRLFEQLPTYSGDAQVAPRVGRAAQAQVHSAGHRDVALTVQQPRADRPEHEEPLVALGPGELHVPKSRPVGMALEVPEAFLRFHAQCIYGAEHVQRLADVRRQVPGLRRPAHPLRDDPRRRHLVLAVPHLAEVDLLPLADPAFAEQVHIPPKLGMFSALCLQILRGEGLDPGAFAG